MSKKKPTYDVFLSYELTESKSAILVEQALSEAGLKVVKPHEIVSGVNIRDFIWRAIATSDAFVIIFSAQKNFASNRGVELGAAMAWHKPIYVVHIETRGIMVPTYLKNFSAYPLSRIDDLAQSIKQGLGPLSQEEKAILLGLYTELRIPTDQLLKEPASVETLANEFELRCGKRVSGERLMQYLMRLRKMGNLPRLRKARS